MTAQSQVPATTDDDGPQKPEEISNTNQLRKFLIRQLVRCADGKIDHDQVRSLCSLAQQIHNTLALELKFATLKRDANALVAPVSL